MSDIKHVEEIETLQLNDTVKRLLRTAHRLSQIINEIGDLDYTYVSGSKRMVDSAQREVHELAKAVRNEMGWQLHGVLKDVLYEKEMSGSQSETVESNDAELPPHLHVQYLCEYCQKTTNEPDTHRYCKEDEL